MIWFFDRIFFFFMYFSCLRPWFRKIAKSGIDNKWICGIKTDIGRRTNIKRLVWSYFELKNGVSGQELAILMKLVTYNPFLFKLVGNEIERNVQDNICVRISRKSLTRYYRILRTQFDENEIYHRIFLEAEQTFNG